MLCFVWHHYTRYFCRYMRCILHYEVMIPRGLGRSFWKFHNAMGADIEDPPVHYFLFLSCTNVFSWRQRNGDSLKETETWRSDWEISNWTHYSGHCLQVVGARNGNVRHKFLQWYDVFANRMHQIWGTSTEETRGNMWCPYFLYSTVFARWFTTSGIKEFRECGLLISEFTNIRECGLLEDEAIWIEQVRVHWHFQTKTLSLKS